MKFNGDISLGKQTITRQQYMKERGEKNGHPVDWKPQHSRFVENLRNNDD